MKHIPSIVSIIAVFFGGIASGYVLFEDNSKVPPVFIEDSTPLNKEEQNTPTTVNQALENSSETKNQELPQNILPQISSQKIEKVYDILQENYVSPEEITTENIEEWIIRGILYSVEDPYTDYFNEEQSEEFHQEMKGDFEGIGAVLEKRKKNLYITEVLKNRPAAKAGLLPGDIIISVDGESTSDETIWDSVLRIRGEKGTDVTLEIVRKGERKEITVTRANIHVESVVLSWAGENNDIAVLEISQFGDELENEFIPIFQEMQRNNPKGIVLDMRYNGGGYMDGAVFLSSFFLEEEQTVVQIETKYGIEDVLMTKPQYPRDTQTPLIVLINGGTASSAEIVTGALMDYNRATTLGENSFGKGVVQQIFPMRAGSDEFVKVTIARWLTPNGTNVTTEEPLQPEILVEWDRTEMTDAQFEQGYDPQLERAVNELENEISL